MVCFLGRGDVGQSMVKWKLDSRGVSSLMVAVSVMVLAAVPGAVAEEDPGPSGPQPPQALVAVPVFFDAGTNNTTVLLAWFPPADDGGSTVTEYRVYRAVAEAPTRPVDFALVGSASSTAFMDNVTGPEGAVPTVYEYVVTAVNAVGESTFSNSAYASGASSPTDGEGMIESCVDLVIGVPPGFAINPEQCLQSIASLAPVLLDYVAPEWLSDGEE